MSSSDTSKTNEILINVFNKQPSKKNNTAESTTTTEKQFIDLLKGMTPAQIMAVISTINK